MVITFSYLKLLVLVFDSLANGSGFPEIHRSPINFFDCRGYVGFVSSYKMSSR